MPMPSTYRHASREWQAFLADAGEAMDLVSDNATYTAVEGVLLAFRRRLTPQQALDFADILPAVLRAVFVAGWRIADRPSPADTRAEWTAEAKALRPDHNLTPDNCVAATAYALRRAVRRPDLERLLAGLPPFASDFWTPPGIDPATLAPRIV